MEKDLFSEIEYLSKKVETLSLKIDAILEKEKEQQLKNRVQAEYVEIVKNKVALTVKIIGALAAAVSALWAYFLTIYK